MWNACVRVCASLFLPWPAGSVLRAATSTPPIATFPVSSLTKLGLNDYGTLRTIYWIYDANTWGMNVLLDICCQHLEKICNFEGFCLGNEHILYMLPTFENICKLEGFCGPFGPRVGKCIGGWICPQRRLSSTSPVLNVAVLNVVSPQCPIGEGGTN